MVRKNNGSPLVILAIIVLGAVFIFNTQESTLRTFIRWFNKPIVEWVNDPYFIIFLIIVMVPVFLLYVISRSKEIRF